MVSRNYNLSISMSTSRTKQIVIAGLFLCFGVMVCILGYTRIISLFKIMEVGGKGQAPERSLRVTIDKSQREQLFDQLSKFAEKHSFEHQITDFDKKGENFQYWMSRDDITIIASNPFDPGKFNIRFYAKYPGYPVDEEIVDELLNDLKSFISEIPNVTISEEK